MHNHGSKIVNRDTESDVETYALDEDDDDEDTNTNYFDKNFSYE